jgi:hypothetical protein
MGIVVRLAQESDIARYLEMSEQCWHAAGQAGTAKMHSRLRVNPKGVYAAESDGVVVGMVTTIRLSGYDVSKGMSWAETTADGWCTTHDPNGDVLFGVDLTTASEKPDGVAGSLLHAIARDIIRSDLRFGILGGRLPGYRKHSHLMTAAEYSVARTRGGRYLDAQVRMYHRDGLEVLNVVPNYFPDPKSCDYGVLLRWRNPFYGWPMPWLWSFTVPLLYRLERAVSTRRSRRLGRRRSEIEAAPAGIDPV